MTEQNSVNNNEGQIEQQNKQQNEQQKKKSPGRPPKKSDGNNDTINTDTTNTDTVTANIDNDNNSEQEDRKEQEKQENKVVRRKKIRRIAENELIPCMSLVPNGLTFKSNRTMSTVKWANWGDVQDVEFRDLKQMKGSNSRFLKEPWILILDEEAAMELGQKDMYKKVIAPEDFSDMIEKEPEVIKEFLKEVPRGNHRAIITKTIMAIDAGELNDIRKIKAIEEALNVDFDLIPKG